MIETKEAVIDNMCNNIVRIIKEKRLSMRKVCRKCGLSDNYISCVRTHRIKSPSLANIIAIANELGVEPYELFLPCDKVSYKKNDIIDYTVNYLFDNNTSR